MNSDGEADLRVRPISAASFRNALQVSKMILGSRLSDQDLAQQERQAL